MRWSSAALLTAAIASPALARPTSCGAAVARKAPVTTVIAGRAPTLDKLIWAPLEPPKRAWQRKRLLA